MQTMEILAVGGFFHDLNFSYIDTSSPSSLVCVEEERFSRRKQHSCLNQQVSSLGGWDYICKQRQHPDKRIELLLLSDHIEQPIYQHLLQIVKPLEVKLVGHHKCHAANVLFFNRDLEKNSQIFVFDAFGDGFSGAVFNDASDLDENILFDSKDSIGIIYTAATKHLGLGTFGSEGKMQGLASYGTYRPEFSIQQFLSVKDCKPSVDSVLALTKYGPNQEMYSSSLGLEIDYFHELIPSRFAGEELTVDHWDFAFTIQRDLFALIKSVIEANIIKSSGSIKTIGVGGGLAQNSSLISYLNQEITDYLFVTSTSCSDRGNSLGALWSHIYADEISFSIQSTPFLGYDADCLSLNTLPSFRLVATGDEAIHTAAKSLFNNELICSFLSRAEYGARALGNRSILANPSLKQMRDYLNLNVKHRELYRPFAAILQPGQTSELLALSKGQPIWMTECVKATTKLYESSPSAVHVDGTCRVQIARADSISPLIAELLKLTSATCNIASIINTSLNDAGEPIVNDHHDLIKTMKSTGIRYVLAIDGFYELISNGN